jgi:hypothetical protein
MQNNPPPLKYWESVVQSPLRRSDVTMQFEINCSKLLNDEDVEAIDGAPASCSARADGVVGSNSTP